MVDHPFGGPWTEIKLDAVQYYLECYAKALTPKKFDLWYIDAFAGTGDRVETRKVGGLLEGIPESTVTETLAGSARRALKVNQRYHVVVDQSWWRNFFLRCSDFCAGLRAPTAFDFFPR
jgi:three-Cys-motif partner protein